LSENPNGKNSPVSLILGKHNAGAHWAFRAHAISLVNELPSDMLDRALKRFEIP
jgi:hypothetical protein